MLPGDEFDFQRLLQTAGAWLLLFLVIYAITRSSL